MQLDDFKNVATNYRVIFFDAFGVLKNYEGLLPGIENTFSWLQSTGKEFYILTNDASRSPQELAESYYRGGGGIRHHTRPDYLVGNAGAGVSGP